MPGPCRLGRRGRTRSCLDDDDSDDGVTPMLRPDEQPRAELFLKEQLHMYADGYRLWTEIVKTHIVAGLK